MQISLSNLKVWLGKFYCTSKNIVHFYLATCYTKMDKTSWPLSTILRYRYSFPNVTFCCLVTRCPIYPVQNHETFRVTQSTFFLDKPSGASFNYLYKKYVLLCHYPFPWFICTNIELFSYLSLFVVSFVYTEIYVNLKHR